ncbi:hypothetical protein Lal_00038613 [Lupinus albus]|nr:hypothetical protein Lal_00038613 [Lupinus albus]
MTLIKNDIYTIHRKDAIEMTISGRQHLLDARNAYLKKDYLSSQKFARKGKEELCLAQQLNFKAAIEIFKIKNHRNDIRKIVDLHGLHAKEAIQALQECLGNIEVKEENHIVQPKLEPCKLKTLQVITGVGKHSQRIPVLPIVIRNYLQENRYRFEEMRSGVLKFKALAINAHDPHTYSEKLQCVGMTQVSKTV